jgi:hypothetical protein
VVDHWVWVQRIQKDENERAHSQREEHGNQKAWVGESRRALVAIQMVWEAFQRVWGEAEGNRLASSHGDRLTQKAWAEESQKALVAIRMAWGAFQKVLGEQEENRSASSHVGRPIHWAWEGENQKVLAGIQLAWEVKRETVPDGCEMDEDGLRVQEQPDDGKCQWDGLSKEMWRRRGRYEPRRPQSCKERRETSSKPWYKARGTR